MKKSLTTGAVAAALVATIGFAYAQTSGSPSSTSGPTQLQQTTPPSSTMTTPTTPSTQTAPADRSSTTTTTQPMSPSNTTTTPSSTTTVTPPAAADMPANSSTRLDEPAPRTDRN